MIMLFYRQILLSILILLSLVVHCRAQDSQEDKTYSQRMSEAELIEDIKEFLENADLTRSYVIKTLSGNTYIGKIEEVGSESIRLTTEDGELQILYTKIESIEMVADESIRDGEYWFPNPNSTRYLIGPSAFNLKRGDGYYQNAYVLFNSVAVGLTDNINIGGGVELLSTIVGQPIFFITPKVGFQVDQDWNVGAGLLYVSALGRSLDFNAGVLYGVATYGTRDDNISAGVGFGFLDGDLSARPAFSLSGMTRTSRRMGLVSENYFIDTGGGLDVVFSYAVRLFGESTCFDLGFINNPDIARSFFIGIPYVDFVTNF